MKITFGYSQTADTKLLLPLFLQLNFSEPSYQIKLSTVQTWISRTWKFLRNIPPVDVIILWRTTKSEVCPLVISSTVLSFTISLCELERITAK